MRVESSCVVPFWWPPIRVQNRGSSSTSESCERKPITTLWKSLATSIHVDTIFFHRISKRKSNVHDYKVFTSIHLCTDCFLNLKWVPFQNLHADTADLRSKRPCRKGYPSLTDFHLSPKIIFFSYFYIDSKGISVCARTFHSPMVLLRICPRVCPVLSINRSTKNRVRCLWHFSEWKHPLYRSFLWKPLPSDLRPFRVPLTPSQTILDHTQAMSDPTES